MIEETQNVLPMFEDQVEPHRNEAAATRWMQELGLQVEGFGHMLRHPTETRPFVYECRFDLLPVKANDSLLVLKGFGQEGPLCAFVNGGAFVGLMRTGEGLLKSGKLKWYEDKYAPANYQERVVRYLKGDFYRV